MKITRRQLRQIIKEEIEYIFEVDVDVDSTVDQDSEIDLDIADHQKKLEKEKKLKELETKIASDAHGLVTSWGLFGRSREGPNRPWNSPRRLLERFLHQNVVQVRLEGCLSPILA